VPKGLLDMPADVLLLFGPYECVVLRFCCKALRRVLGPRCRFLQRAMEVRGWELCNTFVGPGTINNPRGDGTIIRCSFAPASASKHLTLYLALNCHEKLLCWALKKGATCVIHAWSAMVYYGMLVALGMFFPLDISPISQLARRIETVVHRSLHPRKIRPWWETTKARLLLHDATRGTEQIIACLKDTPTMSKSY
jgi:hypothetical protein